METYEKMLENVTATESDKDRFVVPLPQVESHGTKTLVKNFSDIANAIRRTPQEVASYLFKELATSGVVQNGSLVLNAKVNTDSIQKKITNYIRDYVYCKFCGEPDTKLMREGKNLFMVCEACGKRQVVK